MLSFLAMSDLDFDLTPFLDENSISSHGQGKGLMQAPPPPPTLPPANSSSKEYTLSPISLSRQDTVDAKYVVHYDPDYVDSQWHQTESKKNPTPKRASKKNQTKVIAARFNPLKKSTKAAAAKANESESNDLTLTSKLSRAVVERKQDAICIEKGCNTHFDRATRGPLYCPDCLQRKFNNLMAIPCANEECGFNYMVFLDYLKKYYSRKNERWELYAQFFCYDCYQKFPDSIKDFNTQLNNRLNNGEMSHPLSRFLPSAHLPPPEAKKKVEPSAPAKSIYVAGLVMND